MDLKLHVPSIIYTSTYPQFNPHYSWLVMSDDTPRIYKVVLHELCLLVDNPHELVR
jgi:hypothetical protein